MEHVLDSHISESRFFDVTLFIFRMQIKAALGQHNSFQQTKEIKEFPELETQISFYSQCGRGAGEHRQLLRGQLWLGLSWSKTVEAFGDCSLQHDHVKRVILI